MRVAVMGGSLGGLNAAVWLRDAGCDVEVYERSRSPLEGRGAGIVLHPAVLRYFTRHRVLDVRRISAPVQYARYLARAGTVAHEVPARYRFTSWTALYQALLRSFDRERYHLGDEILGFEDDAGGVNVRLGGDQCIRCDLLVCADGIMSTARQILLPSTTPQYAGYVAWRGTVEAEELAHNTWASLQDAVTYFLLPNSHILAYPIPRIDDMPTSARPINWIWYRNVTQGPDLDDLMTDPDGFRHAVSMPPGQLRDTYLRDLREAARDLLPSALAEMVARTARPFLQVIVDVEVPRMAFGRICLIGDAAFTLRPHAAAGTAKAAEDAWQLAQAVIKFDDVVAALEGWEPGQLTLGRQVLARSREAGRRLQIEGTWRVGEPLPFGLYRVGDSSQIDLDDPPAPATGTNQRTSTPRSLG
ncbi:MAG TPA: FAD-dependent monooxygenase [bacterium]|nr:FAD-dependent monooxygenase [bacterium]